MQLAGSFYRTFRSYFFFNPRRLHQEDLQYFFFTLAHLTHAQAPLDKALGYLANASSSATKQLSQSLLKLLNQGVSLSEACAHFPTTFTPQIIVPLRLAESTGDLEGAFRSILAQLERGQALREEMLKAISYPAFILGTILIALFCLTHYLIPQILQFAQDSGVTLSQYTSITFTALLMMKRLLPVILLIISLMLISFFILSRVSPKARKGWDKALLMLPLVGRIHTDTQLAQYLSTTADQLENGQCLQRSLRLSEQLITNTALRSQLSKSRTLLENGTLPTNAFRGVPFPRLVRHTLMVSFETGQLCKGFRNAEGVLKHHLKSKMDSAMKRLEPFLILLLGGVLLLIISALLTPLYDIAVMTTDL